MITDRARKGKKSAQKQNRSRNKFPASARFEKLLSQRKTWLVVVVVWGGRAAMRNEVACKMINFVILVRVANVQHSGFYEFMRGLCRDGCWWKRTVCLRLTMIGATFGDDVGSWQTWEPIEETERLIDFNLPRRLTRLHANWSLPNRVCACVCLS